MVPKDLAGVVPIGPSSIKVKADKNSGGVISCQERSRDV